MAVYKWKKWFKKKRRERFMETGPQEKRSQRVGLFIICSSVSFDSCQCCCLILGSMWWGVSKGSNSSLSPFCAGYCGMSTFWSMSSNGNTSRAVIPGASLVLFLFGALGRPHWKKGKTGSSLIAFGVSDPTQSCLQPVFLFRALSCSCYYFCHILQGCV